MIRVIAYIVLVTALVGVSVWLADRPGAVTIQWEGWRVDTSVPVLAAALVVVAGLLVLGLRILLLMRGLPRRMVARRLDHRRSKGYAALGQGFAAIAEGDSIRAGKLAAQAHARLRDPALTLLLSAQAAALSGNDVLAREHFEAMLGRRETELAGLRGLLDLALKAGDAQDAVGLARRAVALRGDADWAVRALFDLLVGEDRWAEAEGLLATPGRMKVFAADREAHLRAVLATAQAAACLADGDRAEALRLARQALDRVPDFVPAAVMCVTLLAAEGKDRKAAAVVEGTWRRVPHPDLARACFAIWPDDDALRRAQRAEKLAALAPDHLESRLVVAEAAMEAQLWGRVRTQAAPVAEATGGAEATAGAGRAARLMARLEEAERKDVAAANEWLRRAAVAPPDPAWRCAACGAEAEAWSARCPHCRTFDSLAWTAPSRALVTVVAAEN
ncbi:MAG: hypothetical protein H7840_00325 [Alphaproteobacteria bacterium]